MRATIARDPLITIDPSWSPVGWRREPAARIGVRIAGADDEAWTLIEGVADAVGRDRLVILADADRGRFDHRWRARRQGARRGLHVEALATDPGARGRQVHSLAGVVDLPLRSVPPGGHAAWLVEVGSRRVPVISDLEIVRDLPARDHVHRLLDDALLEVVDSTSADDALDTRLRERIGLALRRAVVRQVGADTGRAAPSTSVSVLLATNRPERISDVIDSVAAQTHPNVELVAAVHAPVDDALVRDLRARSERPLEIVDASEVDTLGDVLDRAVDASSGQVLTKMDDDDFYGRDHVFDLLDALDYSGATLVGKGSEFVYLAEIDTTIRRFPHGVETANRNLAGGTLMISGDDLREAGGWQHVPRGVDQALIDDVVTSGGTFHRTHALEFVLNRHGSDHTWQMPVDYFLKQAVAQWPGLALAEAGMKPTTAPA